MKIFTTLGTVILLSATSIQVNAEQIKVEHALGVTTVNSVPKRVVVLGIGPLDALDAFGINPVGVTKVPSTPDYLKKYESDTYSSAGSLFEPDFEKIYSEKPDLILAGPRNSKNYDELSKIAPTVIYSLDSSKGMWEGTQDEWRMIGKIFHIKDKVERKIQQVDKDFKAIESYNQAHPTTAMTVMSMGGNLSAFGSDSRFGSIYKNFGFKEAYHSSKNESSSYNQNDKPNDVAKSETQKPQKQGPKGRHGNLVSYELITETNPDILFVIDKDNLVNHGQSSTREDFENGLIQSTNAYKNNKIDFLDVNAWYVSIAGVHSTEQMIKDIKKVVKID